MTKSGGVAKVGPGCSVLCALLLVGCAPPGQRLFDSEAGKRPVPPVKHIVAKPAPAPFVRIVGVTEKETWAPIVTNAVKLAMTRRPGVVFDVQAILPPSKTITAQATGMRESVDGTLRALADVMRDAGADAYQVMLSTRVDPSATQPFYRIELR